MVIPSEWDKFIIEESLFETVETLNQTALSGKRYYFVHIGKKENLQHHPIGQFNEKKLKPTKKILLKDRQSKFHKHLGDMLLTFCSNDSWRLTRDVVQKKEEHAEVECSDEEDNGKSVPMSKTWEEENVCLDGKLHPNTSQIFRGAEKVPMSVVKAIFVELLSILGNKENLVDFTYANGKKG